MDQNFCIKLEIRIWALGPKIMGPGRGPRFWSNLDLSWASDSGP